MWALQLHAHPDALARIIGHAAHPVRTEHGEGTGTGAAQPAAGASRTVNITIGGRVTPINVASQRDSDALVGLLQQLESAQRTA